MSLSMPRATIKLLPCATVVCRIGCTVRSQNARWMRAGLISTVRNFIRTRWARRLSRPLERERLLVHRQGLSKKHCKAPDPFLTTQGGIFPLIWELAMPVPGWSGRPHSRRTNAKTGLSNKHHYFIPFLYGSISGRILSTWS